MNKFYGEVGYGETVETSPGIWEEKIIERNYYGNVIKRSSMPTNSENLIDGINISQSISIIADAFAYQNFFAIKYVKWMGTCWKVTNVDVQRPRLILTIGGVYNGTPT